MPAIKCTQDGCGNQTADPSGRCHHHVVASVGTRALVGAGVGAIPPSSSSSVPTPEPNSYEEAEQALESAIEDTQGDNPEMSVDSYYADLVEAVATQYPAEVALELCRTKLGWTPAAVGEHVERMRAAENADPAKHAEVREEYRTARNRVQAADNKDDFRAAIANDEIARDLEVKAKRDYGIDLPVEYERERTKTKANAVIKAAATRAETAAREAEEERREIKSNTCSRCFMVRYANGSCGCDE